MIREKRQQEKEATSFFFRVCQCLYVAKDLLLNVFTRKNELGKRDCRCSFAFCRHLFQSRPARPVEYPRLELPSYDLSFEYNMSHESRGLALIFNHEKFLDSRCSTRIGTSVDRDKLTRVFTEFNFEVQVFNNLMVDEISDKLFEIASMDHRGKDCLIVAVMTHGEERNLLHAFDQTYSLEKITSAFTTEKCPSLSGKPRLFFIQACRGDRFDAGHVTTRNALTQRHTFNRKISGNDQLDVNLFNNNSEFFGEDLFFSPPTIHQDFLIVRSTMAMHYSFRNKQTGSWFIEALCEELEKNGDTHDILNLLTHINWKVSERESEGPGPQSHYKQTTCISSMLTKILLFNKTLASTDL